MTGLPDEVWQCIFYHATDNPARAEWEHDGPMDIQSFDVFREEAERELADEALRTKTTICLICIKWQNLSAKFLFEDIRIRHGSFALAQKLEQAIGHSFGAYVRRITIPVDLAGDWDKTLEVSARRILEACPNTRILARRQEQFKARQARRRNSRKRAIGDIQMPHLRRVDWNNAPIARPSFGHMREIPSFIWTTHALEILSISDHVESNLSSLETYFPWCPNDGQNAMESTSLMSIHTLRLDCTLRYGVMAGIQGTRLSSLRRLIIHVIQRSSFKGTFLEAYGPQLQVVEVAIKRVHPEYRFKSWFWRDVLASCPNIQSFHSHVYHLPVYSASDPFKNESLTELKLLMRVKDIGHGGLDSKMPKQAVYDKLLSIIKDRTCFPSLTRIELHGSGWISLYEKSMNGLQQAADQSKLALSFESAEL